VKRDITHAPQGYNNLLRKTGKSNPPDPLRRKGSFNGSLFLKRGWGDLQPHVKYAI